MYRFPSLHSLGLTQILLAGTCLFPVCATTAHALDRDSMHRHPSVELNLDVLSSLRSDTRTTFGSDRDGQEREKLVWQEGPKGDPANRIAMDEVPAPAPKTKKRSDKSKAKVVPSLEATSERQEPAPSKSSPLAPKADPVPVPQPQPRPVTPPKAAEPVSAAKPAVPVPEPVRSEPVRSEPTKPQSEFEKLMDAPPKEPVPAPQSQPQPKKETPVKLPEPVAVPMPAPTTKPEHEVTLSAINVTEPLPAPAPLPKTPDIAIPALPALTPAETLPLDMPPVPQSATPPSITPQPPMPEPVMPAPALPAPALSTPVPPIVPDLPKADDAPKDKKAKDDAKTPQAKIDTTPDVVAPALPTLPEPTLPETPAAIAVPPIDAPTQPLGIAGADKPLEPLPPVAAPTEEKPGMFPNLRKAVAGIFGGDKEPKDGEVVQSKTSPTDAIPGAPTANLPPELPAVPSDASNLPNVIPPESPSRPTDASGLPPLPDFSDMNKAAPTNDPAAAIPAPPSPEASNGLPSLDAIVGDTKPAASNDASPLAFLNRKDDVGSKELPPALPSEAKTATPKAASPAKKDAADQQIAALTPPPAASTEAASVSGGSGTLAAIVGYKGESTEVPNDVKAKIASLTKDVAARNKRVEIYAYTEDTGSKPSLPRRMAMTRGSSVRELMIQEGAPIMNINVKVQSNPGKANTVEVFTLD